VAAAPKPNQRLHTETKPENRTEAERDHDRILYTSALQRLAGITQIAAPESGPTIHNRLTHTLKVSQVARRLAKRLNLNAARQETAAAALAHDLGHPPFGHLAEKVLNEQAKAWGGFEGNAQSFRIVAFLALRTTDYRGLNLTRRTLNGILKYPWLQDVSDARKSEKWGAYETEKSIFDFARKGATVDEKSVEAAMMDWADDVTYAVHDLEDFFRLGLIPLDRLVDADGGERKRFFASFDDPDKPGVLRPKFTDFKPDELQAAMEYLFSGPLLSIEPYRGSRQDRTNLRSQTSFLIGRFVQAASLDKTEPLVIAHEQRAEVAVLKELAWYYVVTDPSLSTIQQGQRCVISELHKTYTRAVDDSQAGWQLFPLAQRELLPHLTKGSERRRLATDFVAGLTEDMAYELHHRLTGVSRGSILDAPARASR